MSEVLDVRAARKCTGVRFTPKNVPSPRSKSQQNFYPIAEAEDE